MIEISEKPLFVVGNNYDKIPNWAIPVRRVKRVDNFGYPLAEDVLEVLRSGADIYFPFALSSVPAIDFLVVSEEKALRSFGRRLREVFGNKPNIKVLESQNSLRVSPLRGKTIRDLPLDLTLMSETNFEECLNRREEPKPNRSDNPMEAFFRDYEEFFKTV